MNQFVAVCGRKLWKGLLAASIPGLMHNLLECMNVHDFAFNGESQVPS